MTARGTPVANRFWMKVNKSTSNGCWEWTGAKCGGYGIFQYEKKAVKAHRFIWFLTSGKWPELNVLHHCDNPSCVNPDHHFFGTIQDNEDDKKSKGRQARGQKIGVSKLSENMVRDIRKSDESGLKLARKYKVTPQAIWYVRNNKVWKHI